MSDTHDRILHAMTQPNSWGHYTPETAEQLLTTLRTETVDQLLPLAALYEIPWADHPHRSPLWVRRAITGGDRWWIADREGRRWSRSLARWVFEPPAEDQCDDTRFTLAEAIPLAHRIAAGTEQPTT